MGHTPLGYRIENGIAVIDEEAAAKVRQLYKNYLGGLSLTNAAKEAGINALHAGSKRFCKISIISVMTFIQPSSIRKPSLLQVEKSSAGQPNLVETIDLKKHLRRRLRYSSALVISQSITTIRQNRLSIYTA